MSIATTLASLARIAIFAGLLAGGAPHAHVPAPSIFRLTEGAVPGVVADGLAKFLGLPYAAPPVGELRWQPPQPAAPWRPHTLQATSFGGTCPQPQRGVFAAPSTTEDCLYLNLY